MQITLMKGKIHRARVTEADLHYEGSISIDRNLIEAAGFLANERVDIYNIDNGARTSIMALDFQPMSYRLPRARVLSASTEPRRARQW